MHDRTHLLCVLVVENDRELRRGYVEALQEAGFRVVEAHNGLQAVDKALELTPDAIVTDLGLPGIDGYELCRRLYREGLSHVPVIAITATFCSAADVQRAIRDGCRAVLFKPLAPGRLAAEVRRLVAV
jgi:CheY-like chemotaxis protein